MFDRPFGLTAVGLEAVLQAGCAAPSLHNSQPWSFRVAADSIEVHVDAARALPIADPTGMEARIACGAVLFNMRLALAKRGVRARTMLGTTATGEAFGAFTAGAPTRISPEFAELERAISHRHTNRRPFFDAEVPFEFRAGLTSAAEQERVSLRFISAPQELNPIRTLAKQAHRIQQADPDWVAEWNRWTGRERPEPYGAPGDGVPISAAGPVPAEQDHWTLRDFGARQTVTAGVALEDRPARLPGRDFESEPLIAVLSTWGDQPFTQLQAGQAMQRVLLTATSQGLAASFVSQLIEVASVREELRRLGGNQSYPQVVLRIGFGGPASATPRRPVAECLVESFAVPELEGTC